MPVLLVEGGRVLDDSPLIVQFADEVAPRGRKLLPASGAARQEALDLERELDLHFAPHVRRFVYFHMLPDRSKTLSLFHSGIPAIEQVVSSVAFPVIRTVMRRFMRVDQAGMQRSLDKVWKALDAIGARLRDGRPCLTGDRFGAADIAFASFAAPLVLPPEHPRLHVPVDRLPAAFGAELRLFRNHPAGQYAQRVYREHRAVVRA